MAPQQPGVILDLSTWGLHPTMDPESASSPGLVGGGKVLTKKHLQSGWRNSYLYRFFNLVYDRPHTPALNKKLLFWAGGEKTSKVENSSHSTRKISYCDQLLGKHW